MSLVGTRPPTVDEWDKYELHHRARLATKPGLTGMWQVSGRSNITDFEEVVKLDKQYISEWTISIIFPDQPFDPVCSPSTKKIKGMSHLQLSMQMTTMERKHLLRFIISL